MKKNCFLLVLLAVLLVLSSCAVPATDNPGNDEKTDSEFFCYTYLAYPVSHPKGDRFISATAVNDAYQAWQEKSEYVIPQEYTIRLADTEFTLPIDPKVTTKVVYRLTYDNGTTKIAAATDFYGNFQGATLFNYDERKQNMLDEDSRPSEEELIAKAKAFAITIWEGEYDIDGAQVTLKESLSFSTKSMKEYSVVFTIRVNGYVIATPTVSIDMNGVIWEVRTNSAVGGIKQSDYQVPSFPEEKMRAAADEYVKRTRPAMDDPLKYGEPTVQLIELFNGQCGLRFEYTYAELTVIVLTEEYAEPAAK